MRKKAWLFLGCLIFLSGVGALLRAIELRTALDRSTMLMDSAPASWLLLALSLLALVFFGFLARKGEFEGLPHRYNRCFGLPGTLAVDAVSLVLAMIGALLCLRERGMDQGMRLFLGLLALTAALAGAAWLALGLDGWRRKKEDSFLSTVLPVIFCGLFLVVFYKNYAQKPALLYTLYPFLGLCASLVALHLISGFAVGRRRPRLTLFLCGAGSYLSVTSLAGVEETSFQLFFAALALELAVHGVCLLLPHDPEPEEPEKAEEGKEGEEPGEAGTEAPESEGTEAGSRAGRDAGVDGDENPAE
jgi:hypothetical protein